jgi:Pectate lyase superfamily protein
MTRLPTVGGDSSAWGTILNSFLGVAHNADGSLKNLFYNVKDPAYGAVGDGTTDDTTAIGLAITAATATGGIVFFPPGNYKISSALVLPSYTIIQGAGDHASTITQTSTTLDCFTGVDITNISIRDIKLVGPASGSGHGVNFTRSANGALPLLNFENLNISNFGSDGIALSNPIVTTMRRVDCLFNGGYGFNIYGVIGGASGTSVSMTSCYANTNTTAGYRFYNMVYSSLSGCAADSNPIAYLFDASSGIALTGCGAEANTVNSFKITGGSSAISLVSCRTFDSHGDAIYVTGSSIAITLVSCVEAGPHAGATSFIKTDAGTDVTLVSCKNITANNLTATTLQLNSAGTGSVFFPGSLATGQSATTPDPGASGTINTANVGVARVTPVASRAGVILQVGTVAGQKCTVINNAASFTITFAASGTSHVAQGVALVIAALGKYDFTWDSVAALWY